MDEEKTPEEKVMELYVTEIALQLTQSERFQRFFKVNYDVRVDVDDTNQSVSIEVVERSPEAARAALEQLLMEHTAQHGSPSIVPANLDDLKSIIGDQS